jgi:HEAT repeat protein
LSGWPLARAAGVLALGFLVGSGGLGLLVWDDLERAPLRASHGPRASAPKARAAAPLRPAPRSAPGRSERASRPPSSTAGAGPGRDDARRDERPDLRDQLARLHDARLEVRAAAASELGQLGPAAAGAVPALLNALREGRTPPTAFSWALGQIGAPAVPGLADTLRATDEDARARAVDALVVIGPPAHDALIHALRDTSPRTRACAAMALGRMGPSAEAASELLIAARDPDEEVRHYAAQALGQAGPDVVPALLAALHSVDPAVRLAAVAALEQRPERRDSSEILSALRAAAEGDSDQDVRHAAAWVLERR